VLVPGEDGWTLTSDGRASEKAVGTARITVDRHPLLLSNGSFFVSTWIHFGSGTHIAVSVHACESLIRESVECNAHGGGGAQAVGADGLVVGAGDALHLCMSFRVPEGESPIGKRFGLHLLMGRLEDGDLTSFEVLIEVLAVESGLRLKKHFGH